MVVSSVFPEYDDPITSVFLFANAGKVYSLLKITGIFISSCIQFATILAPIPEPPKPHIIML